MSIIKTTISVRDSIEIPAPIIGDNGNWWAWDTTTERFVDTGTKAKGEDGKPGEDVDPALLETILSELDDAKTAVGTLQKLTKELQQGKLNINA